MVGQRLEAGSRDRRITIQQATESVGTSKFPVKTWTTLVANLPASKEDVRGDERVVAGQVSARFDTVWTTNYRADIDPDLVDVPKSRRIVFSGRTYDIVTAIHVGRKAGVEFRTLAGSRLP